MTTFESENGQNNAAINWQAERYAIADHVKRAYKAQRDNARRRGIPFRFTLLHWSIWWNLELARLGPDAKRGRRKGQYVMARVGDMGAYEPGNVHATPAEQNIAEMSNEARERSRHKRVGHAAPHLTVRGDGHPRSRAVITPQGRYGSAALAADVHGITRQAAAYRARNHLLGWAYEVKP